ncbi:MAG: hypothetical protein R2743_02630 [Ilumatobacteraceae bacterium]
MLHRAGSVSYPDRFTFVDRPDAPGLQRCFTDEVEVTVAVDRAAGIASIAREDGGPVAYVSPGVAWIDAAAATDGQLGGWIEVTEQDSSRLQTLLWQVVGPSAAAYVEKFQLPESPGGTASSASESATSIELRSDGSVRAVIERLASSDVGDEADQDVELGFTVDFVLDEVGRVVSIVARPASGPGITAADGETFGYVVDYDWSNGVGIEVPDPAAVMPVGEVVDSIVVPVRSAFECSVGG